MDAAQLNAEIFKKHSEGGLGQISYPNPGTIVITYSGGIASGKSTITKLLKEKYHPLIVNNDEVREIIKNVTGERTVSIIQEHMFNYYKEFLREKLFTSPNRVIVLDSSIDRRYEIVNTEYSNKGYRLFIIHFNHPRELLAQRIIKRDGDLAEKNLEILDAGLKDNENFLKQRIPDYEITEKNQDDITALFAAIDSFLLHN